jgi:hypothetical protein
MAGLIANQMFDQPNYGAVLPNGAEQLNKAPTVNNLLEQTMQSYPYLQDKGINYKESFGKSAGFLEFFPPDETGSPSNPRPEEFPINQFGVEVYDPNTRPIDVLADYVSHWGIENDPVVKSVYDTFKNSLDNNQKAMLQEQYQYAKENYGENRDYKTWEEMSGMPGFLRGYTFNQWPEEFNKRAYRPEQINLLNKLKQHLGVND